jgi:excisionase family DNA binding protein
MSGDASTRAHVGRRGEYEHEHEEGRLLSTLEQSIRAIVADEVRRVLGQRDDAGPPGPSSAVMTADEVAAFLGVDRKTVYDYANRGQIPCQKLGKRVLFSRDQLVAWLRGESASVQNGM